MPASQQLEHGGDDRGLARELHASAAVAHGRGDVAEDIGGGGGSVVVGSGPKEDAPQRRVLLHRAKEERLGHREARTVLSEEGNNALLLPGSSSVRIFLFLPGFESWAVAKAAADCAVPTATPDAESLLIEICLPRFVVLRV